MGIRFNKLMCLLLVISCGGLLEGESPTSAPEIRVPTADMDVGSTTTASTVPENAIPDWFRDDGSLPPFLDDAARSLVSDVADVDASQVVNLGAMFVTWPDSSLGCPQPGRFYLQVLTDGYLAFYQVGGRVFRVHTDTGTNAVFCDLPDIQEPMSGS